MAIVVQRSLLGSSIDWGTSSTCCSTSCRCCRWLCSTYWQVMRLQASSGVVVLRGDVVRVVELVIINEHITADFLITKHFGAHWGEAWRRRTVRVSHRWAMPRCKPCDHDWLVSLKRSLSFRILENALALSSLGEWASVWAISCRCAMSL